MDKAVFQFPVPGQDEDEKKDLIRTLKANAAVRKLMEKEQIPAELLLTRTYTFKRWLDQIEPCRGCTSLDGCRQKKTGYRMGLTYDGILQETVETCPYQRIMDKKQSHLANYLVSDLGKEMACVSFENIDLSKEESPGYISAVAMATQACLSNQGVYLYGPMGTGKTYLAACASNYMAKNGKKAVFIHYPSFTERLSHLYRTDEHRTETDRMRFADILVIDDIGAEEVTDKNRSVLLSVLDSRMQNHKMTWFTSNEDFKSLLNHFIVTNKGSDTLEAERILERIRVLGKPVYVSGKDRRHLSAADE